MNKLRDENKYWLRSDFEFGQIYIVLYWGKNTSRKNAVVNLELGLIKYNNSQIKIKWIFITKMV